jgi:uncharacterized protein YuzE
MGGRYICKVNVGQMIARYDLQTDIFALRLNEAPVAESDENRPGIVLDYDSSGNLVGLEILDASKRVPDVKTMQFTVGV